MTGGVTWNELGLVVFLLVIIVVAPKVPEIGEALGERLGRLFSGDAATEDTTNRAPARAPHGGEARAPHPGEEQG